MRPFFSLKELEKESFDVLIVGSGPAGVATAERLYETSPDLRIAIVERGPVLLLSHFYDEVRDLDRRDEFLQRHKECPWEGDLERGGGLLIPALGGRGIVAGSHFPRFYRNDFTLWPNGRWPIAYDELVRYFELAELRLAPRAAATGAAQEAALAALARFGARPPPSRNGTPPHTDAEVSRSHDCAVTRLHRMVLEDSGAARRRLFVAPNAYVMKVEADRAGGDSIARIGCRDTRRPDDVEVRLAARAFVLAASPVESARLVLNSGLGGEATARPTAGCYLAEHSYWHWRVSSSTPPDGKTTGVNVVVPPPGPRLEERFHIEVRSIASPSGERRSSLRVLGSAAMDPAVENRVTLSEVRDRHAVRKAMTTLVHSRPDRERIEVMCHQMTAVARALGADWARPMAPLGIGRSYHEAGTLRMGTSSKDSVTDSNGRVHGVENLFVAGAALFPSVGVANPTLTITALAYRVADGIRARLGSRGLDPWAAARTVSE